MNILILSDIEAGGEWIATQTLLKEVKKTHSNYNFYLISRGKNTFLLDKSIYNDVHFVQQKEFPKPLKHYRELFFELKSSYKLLAKILKQTHFDLIIMSEYLFFLPYLFCVKKFDYAFYFHGVKNNYKIFRDTFNHFLIIKKILEYFAWVFSSAVWCPSQNAINYLKSQGFFLANKKYVIVPNLVRDVFFTKPTNTKINKFKKTLRITDQKIILYLGRYTERKGIKNLVDSFSHLYTKYDNILLVVAYLDFAKDSPPLYSKDVILLKNLNETDLNLLYRITHLSVLPSDFEISPLTFYESLVCSVPFLSTQVGDISSMLKSLDKKNYQLFLIKDQTSQMIGKQLEMALKNYKMFRSLFSNYSHRFLKSYPDILKCALNIFENLINDIPRKT